jgi:hypothetical protein
MRRQAADSTLLSTSCASCVFSCYPKPGSRRANAANGGSSHDCGTLHRRPHLPAIRNHSAGMDGLSTIITSATAGAPIATSPHTSHFRYSSVYRSQDCLLFSDARAKAARRRCNGATRMPNAAPDIENNTIGQRIQPVRKSGIPATTAAANPLTRMPTTPGVVNSRSLRMIPSNVDAIMEKSRVRLAWAAQNRPVRMFPRNTTTDAMCRSFNNRYAMCATDEFRLRVETNCRPTRRVAGPCKGHDNLECPLHPIIRQLQPPAIH